MSGNLDPLRIEASDFSRASSKMSPMATSSTFSDPVIQAAAGAMTGKASSEWYRSAPYINRVGGEGKILAKIVMPCRAWLGAQRPRQLRAQHAGTPVLFNMLDHQLGALPVRDEGTCLGIV